MKKFLISTMAVAIILCFVPAGRVKAEDTVDYVEEVTPGDLMREGRLLYSGFTTTEVRTDAGGDFRFADLSQSFIYRIPILKGATEVTIDVEIANRFLLDASSDNENWVLLFIEEEDIFDGGNVQKHTIVLTDEQLQEQFYFLRMRCRNPESGWGGKMYAFTITQKNAEPGQDMFALRFEPKPVGEGLEMYNLRFIPDSDMEYELLYSGGALTEVKDWGGEPFRYADANQTFTYKIPLPENISVLRLNCDVANRYRFSVSADGEDYEDIFVCDKPVQILDNRVKLSKTLGDGYKNEYLYIKMGDALLEGWGGCVFSIELEIVATAGQIYPPSDDPVGVGEINLENENRNAADTQSSQTPQVNSESESGSDSANWAVIVAIITGGIIIIVAVAIFIIKSKKKP